MRPITYTGYHTQTNKPIYDLHQMSRLEYNRVRTVCKILFFETDTDLEYANTSVNHNHFIVVCVYDPTIRQKKIVQ